ncbi:mannitol-1-phosphate 5-dehydrogenase [Bacillus taeanensis]|uniref:Mannitol-1-phosphate 5-dehydrogenase n=1 Tax=Bacillus taeanensis TaxID=273032 RepID=A0A366Y015_9BACI|nr:mannitol-1-phosphate 5-dehydrogenase [Bacillus taeanensis]RBW70715.1 mannitol-1-phosphate 5-dehydrogenase [Bacillus taeanensis]
MLAVHFGAGNIGRGFIGSLLSQSGYDVYFVDINSELIDALNEKKAYRVVLADESKEELYIEGVQGINSQTNPEKVVEMIAKADLVTTAVGPNVLKFIADLIAGGLRKRANETEKPLNVIACENAIGGSTMLKNSVYEKLSDEEKPAFDKQFGFPDSAVDRIVPDQKNEDKLMVSVEPFYEWVVDESKIIGEKPPVEGVTYVKDLTPYIERKLFTVNTGHAVTAYVGYQFGVKTIKEAMDTSEIRESVERALHETGALLVAKYDFNLQEHTAYINKILKRFENPYISDEVTRVGRAPIRKLGKNDRLAGPAVQIVEMLKEEPTYLALAIAAALLYNYEGDPEAVEVQETIAAQDVIGALKKYSGLTEDHPLTALIVKQYETLKNKVQA